MACGKKTPEIEEALKKIIEPDTAGDPMSGKKWVRNSLANLSDKLSKLEYLASPPTVKRLLKKQNYSLRVNRKNLDSKAQHPDRNNQFEYIQEVRESHPNHNPLISVDSKKKELIGDFKNKGRQWLLKAEEVNSHDFPSEAIGKATPYGIYDLQKNKGYVCVGQSKDTSDFAVDSLIKWWHEVGSKDYPKADEIVILADSGGSNGWRVRLWKHALQTRFADALGLKVTVHHYPRGCSKWNPIEHKLFSHISLNWAGVPLRQFETVLNYIRGTITKQGLRVIASLNTTIYKTGIKITPQQMKGLNISPHKTCPKWNYSIMPTNGSFS